MTTSPESKLLPCPFCGGAPLSEIMDRHHLISCNDEECYAHPVVIVGKTEAIALSRWNKRAPGLIEALKAAQAALAMMVSPDAIQQTSVAGALAAVIEAEVKARVALAKAEGR